MLPDPIFFLIDAVLSGEPDFPRIIACPACSTDDRIIGVIVVLSLEHKHDPQIALHYKASLGRLLELREQDEDLEQMQSLREAIAACKSSDEGEIKIW
jgi:hypothetical protein